jgi:molecular chaperone GrpE
VKSEQGGMDMEEQKQFRNQEEANEANKAALPEEGEAPICDRGEQMQVEDSRHEVEQLLQQVTDYQEQVEQTHAQYLHALADLENFRRRARKEKEDAVKYATLPLLESLLPVMDNFERALAAVDHRDDAHLVKEGVEMVYRQLSTALSQAGIRLIEAKGKMFDPHEHNAVMQVQVEDDHVESGIVVEELQAGYRLHDRVIRPAMVKISS